MVEVFKTNVQEAEQAKYLAETLLKCFPDHRIHFDLNDCDKILRAEATEISAEKIISILNRQGFNCEVLPD